MNEMQPVDNSADGVTALLILNKHVCKSFMYLTVYIAHVLVSPELKRMFVWEYERQLRKLTTDLFVVMEGLLKDHKHVI